MRRLSSWFGRHRYVAWLVIGISHFVLYLITLQLAGSLQLLSYAIPASWFIWAVMLFVAIAFLSSVVKKRSKLSVRGRWGYGLVRTRYAMAMMASYMAVAGWFYNDLHVHFCGHQKLYGSLVSKVAGSQYEKAEEKQGFQSFYNQQKKRLSLQELKQALREAKQIKKLSANNDGAQTLAIIGILVLAAGLAYLVLAAACNVSCAGNDTGAALIGVLGIGLIAWGTVAWIKHVNRKARKKAEAANKAAAALANPGSDSMQ